ncbi:MAG: 5-formyltetrahydrofolate cyclo-ligase [Aeromicrobium sp.]
MSDAASKGALRRQVLQSRQERGAEQRLMVADAIALHMLAAPFTQVDRIACHLSMGTEPGTGPLITGLLQRGAEVIVPVTSSDRRMEWVLFDPAAPLRLSSIGVPEPDGPRLGPEALSDAGLVIVPAMAVDHAGNRLGRGAGYYDRALASVTAPVCAVVHANELMESVPHEDHDVVVHMAVTETGLFRVPTG